MSKKAVKQFLRALESGRMDLETLKESAVIVLETEGWNDPKIKERAQAAAEAYKIYSSEHELQEIPASSESERAVLDFQGYHGKEVIRPNK